MVDAYEQIHGPVDDRSIFDGEITVPPHLRNMLLINLRPNRLHSSLLGSLSRSRTFLTLPTNSRHTFHGSVPNLSHIFTDRSNDKNQWIDTSNSKNSSNKRNSSKVSLLNDNLGKMTSLINASMPVLDESLCRSGTGNDHCTKNTILPYANNNNNINSLNEVELCDSIESSNSSQMDSYMTLIQTNVHNRSSRSLLNRSFNRSPLRTISSLQNGINLTESTTSSISTLSTVSPLTKTTDTFHPDPTFETEEPSLSNLSKFTLPRVSLGNFSSISASTPSSDSVIPTSTLKRFN